MATTAGGFAFGEHADILMDSDVDAADDPPMGRPTNPAANETTDTPTAQAVPKPKRVRKKKPVVHAALAMEGVAFDHVGVVEERGADEDEEMPPALDEDQVEEQQRTFEEEEQQHRTSPFSNDMEDDLDDAQPASGKKAAPSYGATSLVNVIQVMLIALWHLQIILAEDAFARPGAPQGALGDVDSWTVAMRVGFKLTCDAARLINAPLLYKNVTSCILQLWTCGVRTGDWSGAVKNMVYMPQSCKRAFVTRLWFAKDDAVNLEESMAPQMEETKKIEGLQKGLSLDLPMSAAPWWYTRAKVSGFTSAGVPIRGGGCLHKRPLEVEPGTQANKGKGFRREYLVKGVKILPIFMFCFDGATTMAATGVSLRSKTADVFSAEQTDNMGSFLEIRVLRRGQSLTDLAEDISPGCSAASHRDHWLIAFIVSINRRSCSSELQAITREPERQRERPMAQGLGRQARALFADERQSDGRTDTRLPYVEEPMRKLGYDHAKFEPAIDGDCADAATRTLARDALVRMPVKPKLFERSLNDAIWKKAQDPAFSSSSQKTSILAFFGLCILHCAMRTMESCLKLMLTVICERYVADKGQDRKKIDKLLNYKVSSGLHMRKLVKVDCNGQLVKIQVNGEEVRKLIDDLVGASSASVLLNAIYDTYAALGVNEEASHMAKWVVVLGYWARAMRAAYVLRATPADRQTFRENVKCYVVEKAKIRAGCCCWYDWQMYSVMTDIFDKFESLMAISQEGMEACQKRNNMFMRLGNNFSNAGRIPWKVWQAGRDAVRDYMAARKKKKASPEEWLWKRNRMAFFSTFNDVFTRVEEHKRSCKTLDWLTEFSPQWVSFVVISIISSHIAAHRRCKREGRLGGSSASRMVVSWRRAEDGRRLRVVVRWKRTADLAEQLAQYYAPVPCQSSATFAEMPALKQAKAVQRERRARWVKAVKDSALWKAQEGEEPQYEVMYRAGV